MNETKVRILDGALGVFKSKGIKFTMDDLATGLGMSKKTIYAVFPDKGTLLYEMVEHSFDLIKESEDAVLNDPGLNIVEKLRKILCAMPDSYVGVDFSQLYVLKGKYPKAYNRMQERLESGWESTFAVMDDGVASGAFRRVDKRIFQLTSESAIERFLMGDDLQKCGIAYADALEELVKIMVDGLVIR